MTKGKRFSYEGLFASNVPAPQPGGVARRAKYDFAVAYPDPASVPVEGLTEALNDGLRQEGRDLAVYPHPQGYPPLREFVAQKLARDRGIRVSPCLGAV